MVEANAIIFPSWMWKNSLPGTKPTLHLWDSWNPKCEPGVIAQILTNALDAELKQQEVGNYCASNKKTNKTPVCYLT